MPKRTDIHTIMIIGSGPIVIGQGCEFDYSGVQACKVLRKQGYRVVLVNSNPATIMTDPEFADATYVEPLTPEICERIMEQEKPDALLPTVGGQTALNLAKDLAENGALERCSVELIGAKFDSIEIAEDRQLFKDAMTEIGLRSAPSEVVNSVDGALAAAEKLNYPVLVRPSYTLGGSGGGVAFDEADLRRIAENGLKQSPVHEVLIEMSVLGWKEYELEVMRDVNGNFVVVCTIENLDPMGVHTGDSITVAPAQTLTDKELQRLRDMAKQVLDRIGLATGGANVQFAINPADGQVYVIEMNPRVSRSSALASKATGFPIAKIAALLAVGFTLDEIPNDITRVTPASFEPSLDYVVVKMPRWDFAKFPGADATLGPQMKAIGEVMAIGRTFPEALQKGIRALDIGIDGFGSKLLEATPDMLRLPTAQRIFQVAWALHQGVTPEEIIETTHFDPWFVRQLVDIMAIRQEIADKRQPDYAKLLGFGKVELRRWKQYGFSDAQIANLVGLERNDQIRLLRKRLGRRAELLPRRYLRGRVRGAHALSLLDLRGRRRSRADRQEEGRDPRRRTQPHRAGDRVRLLLRPRLLRAERDGLRDDHGQLQPGDGQHRLRHRRPPVLRAADDRGRAQHHRRGTAGRRAGAVRRADAAQHRQVAGGRGRADLGHVGRYD